VIKRIAPFGVVFALGFAFGYQVHVSGAARDAADFARRLHEQRDRRDELVSAEGMASTTETASRAEG
jgi:hypothetical protein